MSKEENMIRVNVFMKAREQSRSLMEMILCDLVYFEKCHELIRIACRELSFKNSISTELYNVIVCDIFDSSVLKP